MCSEMFKVVIKIFIALCFGIVLCLLMIQNNCQLKNKLTKDIHAILEKEWHVQIQTESSAINVFTTTMVFKNGLIRSAINNDFSWQFDTCTIRISPLAYLFGKKIIISVQIENISAKSLYDNGRLALLDHLYTIFSSTNTDTAIFLEKIAVKKMQITINSNSNLLSIFMPGDFVMYKKNNLGDWAGSFQMDGSKIAVDDTLLACDMHGMMLFNKYYHSPDWDNSVSLQTRCLLFDPEKTYAMQGVWNKSIKNLLINDDLNILDMQLVTNQQMSEIIIKGTLPTCIFKNKSISNGIKLTDEDHITLDLVLQKNESYVQVLGSAIFNKSDISQSFFPAMHCTFVNQIPSIHHAIDNTDKTARMYATLRYHLDTGDMTCIAHNVSPITLNSQLGGGCQYVILPNNAHIIAKLYKNREAKILLKGSVSDTFNKIVFPYLILNSIKNDCFFSNGSLNNKNFDLKIGLKPYVHIERIHYFDDKKPLIYFESILNKPFFIAGHIALSMFKKIMDQYTIYPTDDNALLRVTVDQSDVNNINGLIQLCNGEIYTPALYNLVQALSGQFCYQPNNNKLVLKELLIEMTKGIITFPETTIWHTPTYMIKMFNAPFAINNLFLNIHNDFYALANVTGTMSQEEANIPSLVASVRLKKSLMKNIPKMNTSDYEVACITQRLPNIPCTFSIILETERSMTIRTPYIQAQAKACVHITHAPKTSVSGMPVLNGSVKINHGYIKFLNNKLCIEQGTIQFINNNIKDSFIDLTAKNRINQYLITLHISGSMQNPLVTLESSPELPQEQIIGLLLTGKDDTSLQADIFNMIIKNVDHIMPIKHKDNKYNSFIDNMSKTLKHIAISPYKTVDNEQTKLQGSVSIQLSEQLKAQIKKDIDFEKNFSAQIEYFLSDDVTLKVLKNQQGELGSEIEMRFKLG